VRPQKARATARPRHRSTVARSRTPRRAIETSTRPRGRANRACSVAGFEIAPVSPRSSPRAWAPSLGITSLTSRSRARREREGRESRARG